VKTKPAKTTKPATKSVTKIAAKPAGKAAAKAPAKPKTVAKTAKAAGKVASKPPKMAKPAAKPVASKATKPAAKATPAVKKPVAIALSKPSAKPAGKKPLPKVSAPAKPVTKPSHKPSPKTATQASAKNMPTSAPKAVAKPSAKPAPKVALKVSATPAAKAKLLPVVVKKAEKAVATTPVLVAAPKPVVSSNGLPPPPPLKPGRRSSSRALAHMPPPAPMVPTHAPDAAKASYSTMTERVIAPPPHVAAKKDPKLANNWKTKTPETLTDEEVKAMPDAEYMNDMQMAFFRHKLSILKQDIHNSAGATTEHLREDTVVVPDPADRATIEEEHALELRTRDRERKLLKKIEQSIARIDSGDYGYCDETGEPIGVGRLIARPTASLSLEAQQRRELKQKMFGD
jgi:DnaK suppressor protein